MTDNHDWNRAHQLVEDIQLGTTDLREKWLALGQELLRLRAEYPADQDFGTARREQLEELKPQEVSDAMWLARLHLDYQADAFAYFPRRTHPSTIRVGCRERFGPEWGKEVTIEPGFKPFETADKTGVDSSKPAQAEREPANRPAENNSKASTPTRVSSRAKILTKVNAKKAAILYGHYTHPDTRGFLGTIGNNNLLWLAKQVEAGRLTGENKTCISTLSKRLLDPTLPPALAKVRTFTDMKNWFEAKHAPPSEPVSTKPVASNVTKVDPRKITWYGKQFWPREEGGTEEDYNLIYNAFHLIDYLDKQFSSRAATDDYQNSIKSRAVGIRQLAQWIRGVHPAGGQVFHEMASRMVLNHDAVDGDKHCEAPWKMRVEK